MRGVHTLVIFSCLMCASAGAQSATAVSGEVKAESRGGGQVQQASPVPSGAQVSAWGECIEILPLGGIITMTVSGSATATVGIGRSGVNAWAQCGMSATADMVVEYTAATPRAGELRLGLSASPPTGGGPLIGGSLAHIDVGNDGSVTRSVNSFSPGAGAKIPVALSSVPLPVSFHAQASPFLPALGSADIANADAYFTQGATKLGTTPWACGAALTAWLDPAPSLELLAATDAPNPVGGYFLFGLQTQSLPIPPSGCVLQTRIQAVVPVAIQTGVPVPLSLPIPSPTPAGTFYVQFVAIELPWVWSLSNRVRVALP